MCVSFLKKSCPMNLSSLPNENNEFSRCFKYEVEILALQPSSSNEFEASVVQTRTRAMVVLLNGSLELK